MEQFNLEKWLKDKSLKVVTRRGNSVRIICTDRKHGEDELPIVFLEENNGGEFLLTCRKDGRSDNYDTQYDLFFADEEEELTEFEKMLRYVLECYSGHEFASESEIETLKLNAKSLLDLARKELKPEFDKEIDKMLAETDKIVYQKGRQDALKDFPKWKKITDATNLSLTISNGEYYLTLEDLESLPKEE